MLGAVFERFVEKSPISVMVRASLERVLGCALSERLGYCWPTLKQVFIVLSRSSAYSRI